MRHVHSSLATTMEAARLIRHSMEQYVPTLELKGLRFDSVTLCGACGISSFVLHRVLNRLHVKNDFVMGRYVKKGWDFGQHCWVDVFEPQMRVDITATQFSIPAAVHVTSLTDSRYYKKCRNRTAIKQLKDWEDQSHLTNINELMTIVDDVLYELRDSGFVE